MPEVNRNHFEVMAARLVDIATSIGQCHELIKSAYAELQKGNDELKKIYKVLDKKSGG